MSADQMPKSRDEQPEECLLTPDAQREWIEYLDRWESQVYRPLFEARGISRDAALTCWFVNRLRNAIPDLDAGNDLDDEPWKRP